MNIDESLSMGEKIEIETDKEELVQDEAWWEQQYIWNYRDPYITRTLMKDIAPYIEKMKQTETYRQWDKYMTELEITKEVPDLEERWRISKEWYEREYPEAYWEKHYREWVNEMNKKKKNEKKFKMEQEIIDQENQEKEMSNEMKQIF